MEFSHLLPLSALFWLALLGSHVQASLPAEDYWQTMWPNSPMPKALKDLLVQPDWRSTGADVKQQAPISTRVKDWNGAFFFDHYEDHNKESQNTIDKNFPTFYHDKKIDNSKISQFTIDKNFLEFYQDDKNRDNSKIRKITIDKNFLDFYHDDKKQITFDKNFLDFYHDDKKRDNSKISQITVDKNFLDFYHDDKKQITIDKNFLDFYHDDKKTDNFKINQITVEKNFLDFYLDDKKQITIDKNFLDKYHDDKKRDHVNHNKLPNGTFFFEHDLLPGKKVILARIEPSEEFAFLPDKIAKTIPFSSNRLSEILNRLNIEADSTDAKSMKKTLELCEEPAMKGEDKYCATSLESLVDYAVSKLGKNIRLLSTEFERETQDRQYIVAAEGVKEIDGEKAMICHNLNYPYAVFFSHEIIKTRTYSVPLVSTNDGTKVKAVAVCHTDTSSWPSNSAAMKMLNTKPGANPICHFLYTDTFIWVAQSSSLEDDM